MGFIDEIVKLKQERDNFQKALVAFCINTLEIDTPMTCYIEGVRIYKETIEIHFVYKKDVHSCFEDVTVIMPYSPRH